MTDQNEAETGTQQPDWALLSASPQVEPLRDRGPRYTETPRNPYAPDAPFIAEPWNAVTASFFIGIVAVWVWRLRGRYSRFPFLCACLPILLVGGIGGTLYHAFRTHSLYFYLDVIPISILGVTSSVYLACRLWQRRGWWYLLGALSSYIGFTVFMWEVIAPTPYFRQLSGNSNALQINISYASLAVVILIPLICTLIKTRFRHAGWVVSGLISFGIAWFCRLLDIQMGAYMPMGSHWLWHTFGAITTALIIEYFYLVESES